jgi:ribosomal protein S8
MRSLNNFLSSIKIAATNKTTSVCSLYDGKILKVCRALYDLGYISGFTVLGPSKVIIFLKYRNSRSVLRSLTTVSRPSSRTYLRRHNVMGKGIISFIHTNSFLLLNTSSSKEYLIDIECYLLGIGGEPAIVVS